MKTVLLSGATGFLGSRLTEKLLENNYNVIALKRSNSNISRIQNNIKKIICYDIDKIKINQIFNENKIDSIIHTATNYGRNNETVTEVVMSNIIFPLELLQSGIENKVKIFINTDTFTRPDYGRLKNYSLSKKHFNEWMMQFENNIIIFNLIIHQMYGENDNNDKFIPFIIKNMLNKIEKIDLTHGEQKRDFIYLDDVCDAYLKIIENSDNYDNGYYNYEIGTGESVSIKEIVLQIKELIENKNTVLNFGALPYTQNEEMDIKANINNLYENFKWKFKTSLKSGLEKTIKWYKNNLEI